MSKVQNKSSFNIYFKNLFDSNDIDWGANCILSRLAMYDIYM